MEFCSTDLTSMSIALCNSLGSTIDLACSDRLNLDLDVGRLAASSTAVSTSGRGSISGRELLPQYLENAEKHKQYFTLKKTYLLLAEVPSVAWVLNGLSVDAVYSNLLLYPPETPFPSLSFHNLLLGSLLCPLAFWSLLDSTCKGLYSAKLEVIVAGYKMAENLERKKKNSEYFSRKLTWKYIRTVN